MNDYPCHLRVSVSKGNKRVYQMMGKMEKERGRLDFAKTVQIGDYCTVVLQRPVNGILGIGIAGIGREFFLRTNDHPP
jgi:hypothetical protein